MSNALPWFKVEVLQVANDLSDVKSLEGEGAYFRVLRHLWLNGPQPIEQIERKCKHVFIELQHLFNSCSTPDEHLFSIEWLEEQRAKADTWRDNKRKAGIQSATVRASKSKTRNRRSTAVEQPTSSSISTSSLSTKEKEREEKVPAGELPYSSPEFVKAWNAFDQMRTAKRKPMTDRAKELIVADLTKMGETAAIESLNNSTRSGWTDVYPPKRLTTPEHSAERKTLKTTWD